MEQSDWDAMLAAEQEVERAAVRDFVEGALACDGERFGNAIQRLWHDGLNLRVAFRRIARDGGAARNTQALREDMVRLR